MWEFYESIWPAIPFFGNIIIALYWFMESLGLIGFLAAFVITGVTAKGGAWLAGQRATPTIVYRRRDGFGIPYTTPGTPALPRHAKTWLGVAFGGVLKLVSLVFFGISVVTGLKLFVSFMVAAEKAGHSSALYSA